MQLRLSMAAAVFFAAPDLAADEPPPKYVFTMNAIDILKTDTPLAKVLKERFNAAIDIARDEMLRVEAGASNILALGQAMDLLVGAGLELFAQPKERIALLEEAQRYSQHTEKIAEARFKAGLTPMSEVMKAKYVRCTAEIRLLREKERAKK